MMVSFMMVKSSPLLPALVVDPPLRWVRRSDFGSNLMLVGLWWQTLLLTAHSDELDTCTGTTKEPLGHAGLDKSFQFIK
jgi:hypothetical protein